MIDNFFDTNLKKGIAVFLSFALFVGVYLLDMTQEEVIEEDEEILVLYDETFYYEYGEIISLEISEFVDSNNTNLLEDTVIDIDFVYEQDQEYPAKGDYQGTANYLGDVQIFEVCIVDTTVPVFEEISDVTVEVGTDYALIDFEEYVSVDDLSDVTLEFEDIDYDATNAGQYEVKVIATDDSGNSVESVILVYVEEEEEEVASNTTSSSSNSTSDSSSSNSTTSSSSNSSSDSSSSDSLDDSTSSDVTDDDSASDDTSLDDNTTPDDSSTGDDSDSTDTQEDDSSLSDDTVTDDSQDTTTE
ncbi:hypothetical protein [Tannockella kyphosi]|uniref:hypothetical protein n=1 Tax=Tannockella kyphosi TaxID=2899121 RepID=UPI002013978E|nr:hypothetical protein [Tannockella kyphosi]